MSVDGSDAEDADEFGSSMALFVSHAVLGFWVSWSLLLTTSATAVRTLVGLFAAIPVLGTFMTSIVIMARGEGLWRVIGPVGLWTLAVAFLNAISVEEQPSEVAEAPRKKVTKPKPKPKPKHKPAPPSVPREPRSRTTSSRAPDEQALPPRPPRGRGSEATRGIVGEPRDAPFDPARVARRVQRSGGSGLGKASTCRSCGTGIDIFSGRCGCT